MLLFFIGLLIISNIVFAKMWYESEYVRKQEKDRLARADALRIELDDARTVSGRQKKYIKSAEQDIKLLTEQRDEARSVAEKFRKKYLVLKHGESYVENLEIEEQQAKNREIQVKLAQIKSDMINDYLGRFRS